MYCSDAMNIYDYTTSGGKNLIMEYIESLPAASKAEILAVRQLIQRKGKAEKQELEKAKKRAKAEGLL